MTLVASLESKTHSVWNRRIIGNEEDFKFNGTDNFLTAGLTIFGESNAYDLDLCGEDEQLSGIMVGLADEATDMNKDSDDPYTDDNLNVKLATPIPGEELYLTTTTAGTVTFGKIVHCVAGFFKDTDFVAAESGANVPYAGSLMMQARETITAVSGLEDIFLAKRV